jgi:hypothetical protein
VLRLAHAIHGRSRNRSIGTVVADSAVMAVDRVRVSPLVRSSVCGDGLVLLDVGGGVVLASNAVGARIWRLIEDERAIAEIAGCIATEYEVGLDRAARDVDAFIQALSARGLVSPEERC